MTTIKPAFAALALLAALPLKARAAGDSVLELPTVPSSGPETGFMMRGYGPRYDPRYRPEARQGLLLSFGLGGGSMYLSNVGPARLGAADVDFRLGYGFSDRFQMFMDFNADGGNTYQGDRVGSWTWTLRGQTLLVGDRAGNGLNLNFGAGFGGLTYDAGYAYTAASPIGLALAGGLSYDARLAPNFSLSPEFFVTWHQVPNGPGIPDDVSSVYGVRLNLLWYLR